MDDSTYEGNTKNNVRWGNGKQVYKDKMDVLFDGYWVNDYKEGPGTMCIVKDQIKYIYTGLWKEDRMNGRCDISKSVSSSERIHCDKKFYIQGLEIDENIQDSNKDTIYMMVSIGLLTVFISIATNYGQIAESIHNQAMFFTWLLYILFTIFYYKPVYLCNTEIMNEEFFNKIRAIKDMQPKMKMKV